MGFDNLYPRSKRSGAHFTFFDKTNLPARILWEVRAFQSRLWFRDAFSSKFWIAVLEIVETRELETLEKLRVSKIKDSVIDSFVNIYR